MAGSAGFPSRPTSTCVRATDLAPSSRRHRLLSRSFLQTFPRSSPRKTPARCPPPRRAACTILDEAGDPPMNVHEIRRYRMLTRLRDFGVRYRSVFAPIALAEQMFAAIDDAISAVDGHA